MNDLYQMSREEASKLITELIDKKKKNSKSSNQSQTNNAYDTDNIDFNSARLGQTVNLAIHGRGIDYFLDNKEEFVKRVGAIYGLLCEAERGIKASHHSLSTGVQELRATAQLGRKGLGIELSRTYLPLIHETVGTPLTILDRASHQERRTVYTPKCTQGVD